MNEVNLSSDAAVVPCRRRYPDDFKPDAVPLVTEEKYRLKVAAVAVMCDLLKVSTSGYYALLERKSSERAQRHERIKQDTGDIYRQTLRTLGITCSMSRTGCCYDNAAMERFFRSLKHEWTEHESFADLEEARLSVFEYIETLYNPIRIHQTLGSLSPDQYEVEHAPAQAA